MSEVYKVYYRGSKNDFSVFLDSLDAYKKWAVGDKTVPLSEVISSFNVYTPVTGNGTEGEIHEASRQVLAEEFGKFDSVDATIIPKILKEGKLMNVKSKARELRKKRSNPPKEKDKPKYTTMG